MSHAPRLAVLLLSLLVLPTASSAAAPGNVTAVVDGGVLVVTGTTEAETLDLTQLGLATNDAVKISTVFPTTVNGSEAPVIIAGVTNGIEIDVLGGDDVLILHDLATAGAVKIDSGAGEDDVILAALGVGNRVTVKLGADANELHVEQVSCAKLKIVGGELDDDVDLERVEVSGRIELKLGAGRNVMTFRGPSIVSGELAISVDEGNDVVDMDGFDVRKDSEIRLGSGVNICFIHDTVFDRNLTVRDSALVDQGGLFFFENAAVGKKLACGLGAGSDALFLEECAPIGALNVVTRGGLDEVRLDEVALAHGAVVKLGAGDDEFFCADFAAGGKLRILGGSGNDSIEIKTSVPAGGIDVNPGSGQIPAGP